MDTWVPSGVFDESAGVWVCGGATASFPSEGVQAFADVDGDSFWFAHRADVIVDALRSSAPDRSLAGAQVVEIGSGSGVMVERLVREGASVTAVEPSPGGAHLAHRRGASLAIEGTLDQAGLPEASADIVGLYDVIEHLDQWRDVVEGARSLLRPSGRLAVTVPAFSWLWSDHDVWNEHKRRYRRPVLVEDLQSCGFDVVASTYFFAPLLPFGLARALASRLQRNPPAVDTTVERLHEQLSPPGPIDRGVRAVLGVERSLLARTALPFGTSVIAVAEPR